LAITSPTSGCSSARIVRSRTQATEFSLVLVMELYKQGLVLMNKSRNVFLKHAVCMKLL
jgi:hypothetical protein